MSDQTIKQDDATVGAIMRMLRERAEDGRIEIADAGVEGFIEDALRRIMGLTETPK